MRLSASHSPAGRFLSLCKKRDVATETEGLPQLRWFHHSLGVVMLFSTIASLLLLSVLFAAASLELWERKGGEGINI